MRALEELQSNMQTIAQKVGSSVVGIGHRWGAGSGVVIDKGRVLTNAHNLRGSEVTVTLPDGRTETGSAAGVDIDGDVAVIEVDTGDASPVPWAAVEDIAIGAAVFAVANPGGRGLRVTFGLVSGTDKSFRGPRGRRIAGGVEHTAPLLPGSSGGALVAATGELIGLNTHRLGEGFYLALPADATLKRRVDDLARGEAPTRRRLGVAVAPVEVAKRLRRAVGLSEVDGLLVREVDETGPAAAAGVKHGDLLVEVAGKPIASADALFDALETHDGEELALRLLRGTEERTIKVVFGPRS